MDTTAVETRIGWSSFLGVTDQRGISLVGWFPYFNTLFQPAGEGTAGVGMILFQPSTPR
jgi:hypothetical protein